MAPYLGAYPDPKTAGNPFRVLVLLSHFVSSSPPDDPRYQKGYYDLCFIAYYVFFWSMVRQIITVNLCHPFARRFGIRKEGKLDRFGEQGYALIYFTFTGIWGLVRYKLSILDFSDILAAHHGPVTNMVVSR